MLKVIQSYAVIAVGVKVILLNCPVAIPGKATQVQTVLSTQSGSNLADNISFVFGSSFLSSLQAIDLNVEVAKDSPAADEAAKPPDQEHSQSQSYSAVDGGLQDVHVRIVGYISKAGEGVGRADSERQYCYCNGRPVDLPRAVKVMNEVG